MAKKDPKSKELQYWINEIEAYEGGDFEKWTSRAEKVIKRYLDERSGKSGTKFNILWSNVQTLAPALYAQAPKPNVDQRYQDDDDLSRISSQVLERCVSYFVTYNNNFDEVMKQSVLDRLLPGRGVAWVRYCPQFGENPQVSEDAKAGSESEQEAPELYGEEVIVDYVHWKDFGHCYARTWQEVPAAWRRVYLDRKALIKRWGKEIGKKIPLDAKTEEKDRKEEISYKKACIYEIWDKASKRVIWVSKGMPDIIEEIDDPLHLMDFFPFPKPIYATLSNDSLVPVPDYVQYQDQAGELDLITRRISKITEALKVSGVYDSTAQGVQKLLTEGAENKLIPVEQWAVFGEKGGLKGVVDWFPVEQLAAVLDTLVDVRERIKQDLYEITGIADIVRGATNANETATAQKIKGQFATLRLDNMQKDVARFARDLVRIETEIIAEHFSMDTIKQLSGLKLLTQQEKQALTIQAPNGQPLPPEMADLAKLPTWEEVEAVIRNDTARCFRIDIETDSTIKADQEAEKAARTEFLTAAGGFLREASQVPQPELAPLMMEMLLFGVRGFKVGRDMETTFKTTLDKLKKSAENPQPQPNPEKDKLMLEAKKAEGEAQLKGKELQLKEGELGLKARELQLKEMDTKAKYALEDNRTKADVEKERIKAKATAHPEVAMNDPDLNKEGSVTPLMVMMQQNAQQTQAVVASIMQGLQQLAQIQADGNAAVIEAITAPKSAVKDANGNWQVIVGGKRKRAS